MIVYFKIGEHEGKFQLIKRSVLESSSTNSPPYNPQEEERSKALREWDI